METPQHVYTEAAQLLDEGHIKDAYARFLSAVELSTQQLHGVKFVHHTVVSKPVQYEASLAIIRSSLSHLEQIAIQRCPAPPSKIRHGPRDHHGSLEPGRPHTSVSIQEGRATPEEDSHSLRSDRSSTRSRTPPPLPPKPARMSKPSVPPKPNRLPGAAPATGSCPVSVMKPTPQPSVPRSTFMKRNNRGRGNSVSFAEPASDHEQSEGEDTGRVADIEDDYDDDDDEEDDEDDDDDDDEVIDFDNHHDATVTPHRKDPNFSDASSRPQTMTDTQVHKPTIDTRPQSLATTPYESSEASPVDVFAESVVDASMLVPAQTNTGDSLAPPTSTHASDYVPNIPVPPLLTTHRRLQNQLDELEASLSECKARKRALALSSGTRDNSGNSVLDLDRELGDKILQQTAAIAETRETLNKVRTLYMSAATVPDVMQFPPHLVAYQLTLIESTIFRSIPADALLSHSPKRPHSKVVASTDFFNYITRAIEHSILLPQEASRRAELINRWIKIATKCLALNNYQTLKAIVSALGTPPVQRLRRTWDCIPKKRMGRLDLLNNLMSESDNYGRYREHIGFGARRRWRKPVVPFLGVFIHDMTYLTAAVKGTVQDDPRVQDVLRMIQNFQKSPPYPQLPPASYVKASRKHSFRPTAITSALHRSSSSRNRMSNTALFGIAPEDQSREIELQQQLITQYLLMRPWVHEKIIDELSVLREPPKPRSNTSPAYGRSNGNGASNGSTAYNTSSSTQSSSILSNASSLVRLGSGYSANTNSVTSWEDQHNEDATKQRVGFWPFRKSIDLNRPSTLQSDVSVDQNGTWSDDDSKDEEKEEEEGHSDKSAATSQPQSSESVSSRTASATSKILSGHVRSFSLPTARPGVLTDPYSSRKRN